MNQSKINLSDVPNIPVGKLSALPPEQLLILQEQAIQHFQKAKMLKEWLDNSIAFKYRNIAANIRSLDCKDTGAVHFSDGNYRITSTLAKRSIGIRKNSRMLSRRLESMATILMNMSKAPTKSLKPNTPRGQSISKTSSSQHVF